MTVSNAIGFGRGVIDLTCNLCHFIPGPGAIFPHLVQAVWIVAGILDQALVEPHDHVFTDVVKALPLWDGHIVLPAAGYQTGVRLVYVRLVKVNESVERRIQVVGQSALDDVGTGRVHNVRALCVADHEF